MKIQGFGKEGKRFIYLPNEFTQKFLLEKGDELVFHIYDEYMVLTPRRLMKHILKAEKLREY